MRILFLGTPQVAVPCLDALVERGHDVVLAVTRPDRPSGRSRQPLAPPVKKRATELGIPVVQPTRLKRESTLHELGAPKPDLLVVVAYGRILPVQVLGLAPGGAINVHFSLLPKYRGAAPVQWALAHGEPLTGVTTMQIDERLDEGDVLLQQELSIRPGEHAPALQERLATVGAELLTRTLAGLEKGEIEPRMQDHARASFAPILTPADGEIDPGLPAAEIEGRVRGFDPWPGVWVRRGRKRVRLVQVRALPQRRIGEQPGDLLGVDDGLALVCGDGSLLLLERIQPEGRRVMDTRDAINGRQISPGERLESLAGSR